MKVGCQVEKTTLINKWMLFNEKHSSIWIQIVLITLGISATVADWMVGIFSLSDFLFGFIAACLIISGNYWIKKEQFGWILLLLGVIAVNILMNYFNNDLFILKTGIAAFIKVAYYAFFIAGIYNFVKKNSLEALLLKILNIVAIVICMIGIYITIALYLNGKLPYEFFWKLTRTDETSYLYDGIENIFRTRSIFSEPSYLGYYLNIMLGLNYFNKKNIIINKYINLLITLTIILTFSYSAIAVMLGIQAMHFIRLKTIKKIKVNGFLIICLLAVVILTVLAWDIIQVTIIDRTAAILSGTDYSTRGRLWESWQYVNREHLFMGNGIGHTPSIWNIYAYILSDVGLGAFLLFCLFSVYVLMTNFKMGILFILLNFQKGGYLSPEFWIFILLLFIYMGNNTGLLNRIKNMSSKL